MLTFYYKLPEKLFTSASVIEVAKAQIIYQAFRSFDPSEAVKIYAQFTDEYPQSEELKFLAELKKTKTAVKKNATAPNFTLHQSNGKSASLSDFVGKVVYLNFWASWCGPCVAQIPSEKQLAATFKDLVIINISIDTDELLWKNALQKHQLTKGINLISKGWTGEVTKLYGVLSIPQYVLIGKDGKIIHPDAPRPSDDALLPLLKTALDSK